MDISETIAQFPMIMDVFFFCIGACIGSFLNVCILRLPKGESIVSPPSHCACGKLIKWYDNLPIIGWILLRGKARCCKRPISFRYPFVETLTALIFLALWLLLPIHQAIGGMVFASIMIFCTFVGPGDNRFCADRRRNPRRRHGRTRRGAGARPRRRRC